jgi:hypothetical protein
MAILLVLYCYRIYFYRYVTGLKTELLLFILQEIGGVQYPNGCLEDLIMPLKTTGA